MGIASSDPTAGAATQYTDPRIAQAEAGLEMLNEMFPLMKTLYNSEATAATECQDLMGMSFRTFHFDGAVRVPSYLAWLMDCDMRGTYAFHRRVLKLLQWHCPPVLWHLKTPVHMFALDALVEAYPNAKFMWSHRDPAKVIGSVCSLIRYVRSWSSDRDDPEELGAEQLDSWAEAVRRAMDFRKRVGEERFSDVAFADLQSDPVNTLRASYDPWGWCFPMRPPARSSNGPRSTSRALAARMTTSWPISVLPQRGFANDLWSTSTRMTRPHERLSYAAAKPSSPPIPIRAVRSWPQHRNHSANMVSKG